MSPYLFKNIKVRITFRARPQRNWRIQRCPHQHRYLAGWRRCVDFINSVTLQRTTALGWKESGKNLLHEHVLDMKW